MSHAMSESHWMLDNPREGRFLLDVGYLARRQVLVGCWVYTSREGRFLLDVGCLAQRQVLVGCWVSYDIRFLLDLGYLACCARFLLDNPGSHMQWYVFVESQTTNCGVHSGIQYCVSKLVIIEVAQSVL